MLAAVFIILIAITITLCSRGQPRTEDFGSLKEELWQLEESNKRTSSLWGSCPELGCFKLVDNLQAVTACPDNLGVLNHSQNCASIFWVVHKIKIWSQRHKCAYWHWSSIEGVILQD